MNYMKLVLMRLCKVVIILLAIIYILSFLWVLEYILTGKHPFVGSLETGGVSDRVIGIAMKWVEDREKLIKSKLK